MYLGEGKEKEGGDFFGVPQMETTFVREVTVNYKQQTAYTDTLRNPEEVAAVVRGLLPDNSREHFLALYLSSAHKIVAYSVVSTGLANSTVVHPREVFQPAILAGATAIFISHNHPSGETRPSSEDEKVTKRLKEVADLIGMRLLDHVIVTDTSYYSFVEGGQLY